MSNTQVMTFVVTLNYSNYLEAQVVRNYVNMALHKYYKHVKNSPTGGYFDMVPLPKILIQEIPILNDKDENIRAIIHQVKLIGDLLDGAPTLGGRYDEDQIKNSNP